MEIFGEGYSTTFELLEYTADAVMTCYLLWLPRVEKRHTTLFTHACSHKLSTQGGPIIAATALYVDSTLQFTRLFTHVTLFPFQYPHDEGGQVVYVPVYK